MLMELGLAKRQGVYEDARKKAKFQRRKCYITNVAYTVTRGDCWLLQHCGVRWNGVARGQKRFPGLLWDFARSMCKSCQPGL